MIDDLFLLGFEYEYVKSIEIIMIRVNFKACVYMFIEKFLKVINLIKFYTLLDN